MAHPSTRLFFALWPNAPLQARMARVAYLWRAVAGARLLPAASLHTTLVFLGETKLADVERVRAAADCVRAPAFQLKLDSVGVWRRNGIGWLAPSQPPPALSELDRALRAALRARHIAFDDKELKPHVTLARHLTRGSAAESQLEPIYWQIEEFALMRSYLSAKGARYEALRRWPLDAATLSENLTDSQK